MTRRWLLLLGLLVVCGDASALKFRAVEDSQGRSVLIAYDCAKVESRDACRDYENKFSGPSSKTGYAGDAAVLESKLKAQGYYQVWLYSGGGNLAEGVKVGEVLRRYQQYVVVPDGASCVSACTVAFLGGVLREVEPKGSYEVHAYSGELDETKESLARYASQEGDTSLVKFVKENSESGRVWVARLFLYVQRMIGGRPSEDATVQVLSGAPDYAKSYLGGPSFRSDLARMRAEGATTTQDILMRIERESFETRLAYLKSHADQLGARAVPAVRILEIMFSSRIAGTAQLDQVTLKENGYTNVRK